MRKQRIRQIREMVNADILSCLSWTMLVAVAHIPLLYFTEESSFFFISKAPLIFGAILFKKFYRMFKSEDTKFTDLFTQLMSGFLALLFSAIIVDEIVLMKFERAGIGAFVFAVLYIVSVALLSNMEEDPDKEPEEMMYFMRS